MSDKRTKLAAERPGHVLAEMVAAGEVRLPRGVTAEVTLARGEDSRAESLAARARRAEEMLAERDADYSRALADSGRMLRERNLALAAVEAQLAALRDAARGVLALFDGDGDEDPAREDLHAGLCGLRDALSDTAPASEPADSPARSSAVVDRVGPTDHRQVARALRVTGGDVERAVDLLFLARLPW